MFCGRYERDLQYEETRIGGTIGRVKERYARSKQNDLYLVRDGITISMDDILRAVSGNDETESGTSLVVDLVDLFMESTVRSFMVHVHEIAEEGEENVPDSKVQLAFLNFGYILDGFIATLRDVDFKERCVRKTG